MNYLRIAIDGPSGVGKSTTAKGVAKRLDITYLDTGAIFRTLALYCMQRGLNLDDEDEIAHAISKIDLDVRFIDNVQHMFLFDEDVTFDLRTRDISQAASIISQYPAVRNEVLKLEKKVAKRQSVIMDGRDIGTVVLPNADLKVFLTADTRERALRRYRELKDEGKLNERTLADIEEELKERDLRDSLREEAPLKKAEDAILIDSTNLSAREVEDIIINHMEKKSWK